MCVCKWCAAQRLSFINRFGQVLYLSRLKLYANLLGRVMREAAAAPRQCRMMDIFDVCQYSGSG